MRNHSWIWLVFPLIISCKTADLRTADISENGFKKEEKALLILNSSIEQQGLQALKDAEVYSIKVRDDWKGLNRVASPFPKDNQVMIFRFRPESFDGQFEYIEDPKERVYGVQSFQFYKSKMAQPARFKGRKGLVFGINAIHYLFELPLRMREAEYIKYAGTTTLNGQRYDRIFVTWGSIEPNKQHDQYLLYINQVSGLLEYASFTIRKPHIPSPKNIYGSIKYELWETHSTGIRYPSLGRIFVNGIKEDKKAARTIYLRELTLDSFELDLLYPNPDLPFMGDGKPNNQP